MDNPIKIRPPWPLILVSIVFKFYSALLLILVIGLNMGPAIDSQALGPKFTTTAIQAGLTIAFYLCGRRLLRLERKALIPSIVLCLLIIGQHLTVNVRGSPAPVLITAGIFLSCIGVLFYYRKKFA